VLEGDGGVHTESAERDEARVRALEAMGYGVLRLDARLVSERIGEAVACAAPMPPPGRGARAGGRRWTSPRGVAGTRRRRGACAMHAP
jgi:hypothetical protein